MTPPAEQTFRFRPLVIAAGLALAGVFTTAAFSAWLHYGPDIFLALSDSAINWCL
ncbi:hypothetical protein NOF55_04930 [Rhizobiaceae bacterium BDR2-2]|uniref:Uncharacterized protein n=1 Tax=Ectorhizobium quercum TaxID=2965071 RepID=A0AAE3SVJ7_9HYPH|nr:hypothetical protein [Ectorhizobium quercum]MCX8996445.1 hypothetical protein [Ectorhizobium quercum]